MIKTLEKNIKSRIKKIENGTLTPAESGIGKQLNKLKTLDEPLYDELLEKYKEVLKNLKK